MGKKTRDLAALAGLAGLAYAYNKNKGDKDDAGDQKTSSYTGDTKKVAASDDRMSNEDYIKSRMKKAPEDEKGSAQSDVLKAVTAPKAAPNDKAPNQGVVPSKTVTPPKVKPKLETITTRKDPRLAETGTSRGRPAEAKNPNYSNEGRSSVAPTTSSKVGDAVKTVAKTVAQGPAGVMATTAKPVADKAANAMRETYRDLSGKIQYKTPDIPSAAKTASDAVGDALSKPFRAIREAGNRDNPDVKMARGGMTASRRGDGIAQRGKTRGKMC